jgi:hypothetical protein
MTPKEYREDISRQLKLGLITLQEYNLELAAIRLAEQIIKD